MSEFSSGKTVTATDQVPDTILEAGAMALEAFLDWFSAIANPGTQANYRSVARRFFAWVKEKEIPLLAIRREHVTAYLDQIPVSTRTQNQSVIRKVFQQFAEKGIVPESAVPEGRVNLADTDITLRTLKNILRRADPLLPEEDKRFKAALVLLAGLYLGTKDLEALSEFTEVPLDTVESIGKNMRASGVWTEDGLTACNWRSDGPKGEIEFWLDVLVAVGRVERVEENKYKAVPKEGA